MNRPGATLPQARAPLQPAGLATRLLAATVDALVLAACLGALYFGLLALRAVVLIRPAGHEISSLIWSVAPLLLVPAYHIAFWSLAGWTPGKWLLGLRVTALDGRRPGLARSAVRFAAYTLSIVPLMAGVLAIALDPMRRAWHDRLAGTLVVREQRRTVSQIHVRLAPADGQQRP